MNKTFIIVLITLSLITYIYSKPIKVNADSGFDTSYDGGGWSSSSSDWSSSGSSSSSNDSNEKPITFKDFIIYVVINAVMLAIGIIYLIIRKILDKMFPDRKKKQEAKYENQNSLNITKNNIDENIIKKFIPEYNKEQFLNDRYNDYLQIQEDWMNFNYDSLRERLTDELYNQYEMQLDTLKVKNEKNIMKDFNLIQSNITNIREENGVIIVNLEMIISFIDYIDKNGTAVRGSKTNKVYQHYSMTFVMKSQPVNKCPNCGAELDNNSAQICSYCRSKITRLGSKWVLSKKESLKQR